MPGNFIGPEGDLEIFLENNFVTEYDMIDRYVTTGSLWAWGAGNEGVLGDNTTQPKSSPVQTVAGGTNWKEVSIFGLGAGPSVGIKTDGTLWTWGRNSEGQLGNNATIERSSPIQTVAAGTNWKQVSTGSQACGAIKTDGTLWTWGDNTYGQIGDNTTTRRSSPVQTVVGGNNWKQLSFGYNCGAIKTDGTLWMWGAGNNGALGDNTTTSRSSPIQTIAGGTNWKQVSVGNLTTAAIKTDGTLWTWGRNNYGELGDNTITNKSSPVQTIAAGTNWKQVSASTSFVHCGAIKTDGSLWTWGRNDYGQLGDNTTTNKSSPVQTVAGGTNWKQVSKGSIHAAAIKTDGTLWTWGYNNIGQLGDNTTINKSSPIQTVAGGTNWKQVFGGYSRTMAIHFYDADNLYPSA